MPFISKKKIIFIVSSLLVVAAVVYAAQWRWHFWRSVSLQNDPSRSINPMNDDFLGYANDLPNNGIGIKEVLSAHLFGQEELAKNMANSSGAVPKTQQPLELHGIVFIPHHPERAVALIAQAGGIAKDYKTGDEILPLPGWKVYLISPTSVQIEHAGTVELLELPRSVVAQPENPQAENLANQFNNVPSPEENLPSPEENMPVPQENMPLPQENMPPPPENMPVPQGNPILPNVPPPPAVVPIENIQELG